MMYSVSSELYLEVAARLAEAIGGGSYFSGSLTFLSIIDIYLADLN